MICVDGLAEGRWRYGWSCHLFDDDGDLNELHFFAARLGLKRKYLHNDRRLPHYDLSKSKRNLACALGAREVSRGYVGGVMKEVYGAS